MREELALREAEVEHLLLGGLRALVKAVEAKDAYTRGHSRRVTDYFALLLKRAGLDASPRVLLGAELPDLGKIGIPDSILNKPGRLTEEELAAVRRHPEAGVRILAPFIEDADVLSLVELHHERWDGQGYPHGLAGEDIPQLSQILAVADVFDAITSARAYRAARAWDHADSEIRRNRGQQFSPAAVDLFESCAQEIYASYSTASWETGRRG
jgi:HD-GYP domain-containing protein (c-di-GMP phosphodiesterase class II)